MRDYCRQNLHNRPTPASDGATYWEIARWIVVGGLAMSLVLTYAWFQMEILNVSYDIERIRRDNSELVETNAALRAEQSSLINPIRIDRQAQELGLIRSNREEVLIVRDLPPLELPRRDLVAEARQHNENMRE